MHFSEVFITFYLFFWDKLGSCLLLAPALSHVVRYVDAIASRFGGWLSFWIPKSSRPSACEHTITQQPAKEPNCLTALQQAHKPFMSFMWGTMKMLLVVDPCRERGWAETKMVFTWTPANHRKLVAKSKGAWNDPKESIPVRNHTTGRYIELPPFYSPTHK